MNSKQLMLPFLFILAMNLGFSQLSFDKTFKTYTKGTVEVVSAEDLAKTLNAVVILDARESNEYHVSHLKNAVHVGYNEFDIQKIIRQLPNKNQGIVVYCSIGARSETIGNALKQAGYTHVKNLYGGIFEWKNKNLPVYNLKEQETDSIHIYSKQWGKWLLKGIQVY